MYSLEAPQQGTSNEYSQHMFLWGNKKTTYLDTPFIWNYVTLNIQGPVVQSVVSLTSSLRVISLTVLADTIHNILIFFAEKM